ncbi:phosphoribosylamine--glycine ligase [Alphaproteobacteria bacterium]|nr:phosphoribosylamine--glycine ligase [Alphaproteobacteria bacterium]
MKILLIGSGGREHALAWSIADSPLTQQLVIAPGNPGMAAYGKLVDIAADDIEAICDYAAAMPADMVVVGPEVPLVMGLVDRLNEQNIPAFGPMAAAAKLEGSKEFARAFCQRHNIPQPAFFPADDYATACLHIDALGDCVIKADGLAAGKGVVVAESTTEAKQAAEEMLAGQFGSASSRIVIEQKISGPEASLFALLDGENAILMATAQDHKRAFDGDTGPNTGGMGAISPAPRLSPEMESDVMECIVRPVARGMAGEGMPYHGVLYVGLMLTADGPQVIEFNCRFGDPEAQVILPRLRTDIVSAMLATTNNSLAHFDMRWDSRSAVTVVIANQGYPGAYSKGSAIKNIEAADNQHDQFVFHAGTALDASGQLVASGGRVLAVTGLADSAADARARAYDAVAKIDWPKGFYRRDIAGS